MRVTNHRKDNFITYKDGTICRGTITMTEQEFLQAEKYLQKRYEQAKRDRDTYIRDSLAYTKLLPENKKVVMGITATKLIFEKFKLPRYKEQNYLWEVK